MKNKKKATKDTFVTFNYETDTYDFSGRAYPEQQRTFGKITSTPVSLTLDEMLTIKGCHLKQTEKGCWLEFPQYKSGNEYKSFVYYVEGLTDHMKELANVIAAAIA